MIPAKLITQSFCDSTFELVHHHWRSTYRLVVYAEGQEDDDEYALVVSNIDGQFIVTEGYEFDPNSIKVIREFEVDEEVYSLLQHYLDCERGMRGELDRFNLGDATKEEDKPPATWVENFFKNMPKPDYTFYKIDK